MNVRKRICDWCEKTYAIKDSTASRRDCFCSEECEAEQKLRYKECNGWMLEIDRAWDKYSVEYEPSEDEERPCYVNSTACQHPYTRSEYLAFQQRYQRWKTNRCWKKSFWTWNGSSSSGSFSGGGFPSSGGSFSVVDCVKGIVGLIVILLIIWWGWSVIKCGWNWIFGGSSEVDVEAEMMKTWQQHLEQRCEAFGDGLPEREVEAKGLRNYSWNEWQEKCQKEREGIQEAKKKESGGNGESYVTQRAREIGNQAKELGDKAKDLWRKVTK